MQINHHINAQSMNKKKPWIPAKHSKGRRAKHHNYRMPGIYLITIVTKNRFPLLGRLVTDTIPYIEFTPLGKTIAYNEIPRIQYIYPMVEVYRYCIMPDHIHLIIRVNAELPKKSHLGKIIGGFKQGCNHVFWNNVQNDGQSIFEPRYNDRILYKYEMLGTWKKYLRDNPRRLAVKRAHPELFRAVYNMEIAGYRCQIYGNRYLLENPDKVAVIVHNDDDDEVYKKKIREWLSCGERGGVIIGTAISVRERWVMNEAFIRGYSVIQLCQQGFDSFYKPKGVKFDACAQGQLLLVSPWDYNPNQPKLTRIQCQYLNRMGEAIVAAGQSSAPEARRQ